MKLAPAIVGLSLALPPVTATAVLSSELHVLLPPPARPIVERAARLYSGEHPGTMVSFDEGAGVALVNKARSGAALDLVIGAGSFMKTLKDEGLVRTPEQVAEGYSVVAFRKGSSAPRVETPADIKNLISKATKISLSDPAQGGASSGFFMSLAKDQGVEADLRQKALFVPGGHGADPVDRGDAEFGVAQQSEVLSLHGIDTVPLIPTDPKSRIPYLMAVSSKPASVDEANAFFRFLKSDAVAKLKGEYGLH